MICLMVGSSHQFLEGIFIKGIICPEVTAYQLLDLSQSVDGSNNGPVIQFAGDLLKYHL